MSDVSSSPAPPLECGAQSPELLQWLRLVGAGVAVARFAGFDAQDRFLVAMPTLSQPQPAASTIGLAAGDVGEEVVVAFESGDARRVIIVGRLHRQRLPRVDAITPPVRMEGERLVLQAEREIELRCGDARIVLTRAGKVMIHGNHVLSRSRGANRIKGACVDIN